MNRIQSSNGIPNDHNDKAKDWQLEILMEKLRSKASQCKTLPEISKNVRMTLLEKRYASDSVEKSQHQKCLDTLQHSIKVTSLQSMVERLESLTRQLGLKFVVEPSGVFISSDMFYLEIVLGSSGAVEDVKIHHEGKKEQQSCVELVNCLSKGDFNDFTTQLEGFTSIYQLNAEKKIKCKAFTALESLEADLITLSQLQTFIKEPFNLIHKSPVGILERRKGGHPMKLTYFVSPYDLLNVEKNEIEPINIDTVINKKMGYSVTVCMEGSAAHKLQTTTLITVNKNINGKSTPSYAPVNSQNSAVIPACFLLKLNKPLPMCLSLVRQIQQIYPWTDIDSAPVQPMLNLIVSECSDNKMNSANNKGLFVTLPDQNHCYFMTESKTMEGVLVTTIPFTHPANVANILMLLREQALFNTIISSCVRPNSKQDFDNMTMFEVSALSPVHISILLEHPVEESMATAEIDLSDISNVICRIHSPSSSSPVHPPPDIATELSSKILNKSLSVPITLRSVIKLWEQQSMKRNHYGGHENFSLPLGAGDPGGPKDPTSTNLVEFGGLNDKIKQESSGNSSHNMMMQASQDMFLNETMMTSNFPNFPPSDGVLTTLELTNILSENVEKDSKRQKRKHDDSNKSGKRKVGTEETDILESSSSDSTSRSTPVSQETEIRTPNSILGFQTDLELSGLDPMDLLNAADKQEVAFENLEDLDLEEIATKDFKRENEETTPLILKNDLEETVHGLSITPITSGKEKRPTSDPIVVADSLTITPVPNLSKNLEEKPRDRKSKSLRDEKSKLDKKRKRKRDESPMGPPEKVPYKQDFIAKPVAMSLKSTESPPPSTPSSPNTARKFSPPVPNRPSSLSGKLSPNMMKSSLKSSSSHHSPKHSPAHVPSSPKQNMTELSSPKHLGSSPKHPSVAGSGKPSMSALKNAANSPSGKSSSESKSKPGKDSSREKDKKMSNSVSVPNPKNKTSSNKSKSLESSASDAAADNSSSPNSNSDSSKINSNQLRINRKGSLSAIVDKLKVNAQHCDNASDLISKSSSNKDRTISSGSKLNESSKTVVKIGDAKNSEYMVKPSSDGMKITINKTRSKDNSSSKQSSSTLISKANSMNSPKTHTGLKPGVNSGPASKKPQVQKSTNSFSPSTTPINSSSSTTSSGSSSKTFSHSAKSTSTNYSKSSSGLNNNSMTLSKSNSKLTSSPKMNSSTDINRSKDKTKFSKTNTEKSLLSSLRESRKSSPILSREEADNVYKISQSTLMEGRIKTLDKNFQIPKLSARTSDDKKGIRNDVTNINRDKLDQKVYEVISKNDSKYSVGNQLFDNAAVRNSLPFNLEVNEENQGKKDVTHNLTSIQGKEDNNRMESASKLYPDPLGFSSTLLKNIDFSSSKFIAPAPRDERKDIRKNEEVLDFSAKSQQPLPQSPSVSVHIVKSPAPSPLINRSPLSASPGITDDELMDEALVGMGK